MTHKVAVEAFEKAGDPEAYVGEGEPWTPLKLYYDRAFNPERTLALHEHLLDTHGESLLSGWIENLAHRASSGRHLATRLRPASWFTSTLSSAIRLCARTPRRWTRTACSSPFPVNS